MKRISRIVVLTLVLAMALSASAFAAMSAGDLVAEAKGKITQISPMELQMRLEMGEKLLVIDIRNKEEFLAGHIPGAVNVTRDLLEFKIADLVPDPETEFVVNCKSGGRSSLAAEQLVRMGYTNVLNLDGGMKAWMQSGYPVETALGLFTLAQ
ncbi:MAG: sulfurtransferase [Firmicutes bacterium]|nr:sulfurtransferase [Bacillota bacterium]